MIEQTGKVVAVEGEFAWVATLRESACGKCQSSQTCGTGVISKLFNSARHDSKVVNRLGAQQGDSVVIGIDEKTVIRSALIVYMLPLLTLIVAALVADTLFQSSEWITALGGGLGLLSGLIFVRWFNQRIQHNPRYHAVLLRRLSDAIPVQQH